MKDVGDRKQSIVTFIGLSLVLFGLCRFIALLLFYFVLVSPGLFGFKCV